MTPAPRGFALLTVLWVMNVAGIAAVIALRASRDAFEGQANRVEWQRGYWRVAGCARRVQAIGDSILEGKSLPEVDREWKTIDHQLIAATSLTSCRFSLAAAGTRLDLNAAAREQIERILAPEFGADASAIAERILEARSVRPFANIRELQDIAGLDRWVGGDSLFTVEPGLVSLANAGAAVLQSVPGIGPEVAQLIVDRQHEGDPIGSLTELIDLGGAGAATDLVARFPDAMRSSTATPSAWVLTVRETKTSGLTTTLTCRLELAGGVIRVARFEAE